MKYIGLLFCLMLFTGSILPSVYGLTKEEKKQQLIQRENALKQIKVATLNVGKFKPSDKIIAVELQSTCIVALKTHVKTGCPSYDVLLPFDETTPYQRKYIGDFINDTWFHRDNHFLKNPEVMFRTNSSFVVCVDCPKTMMQSGYVITLVSPQLFVWINRADSMVNNTRIQYENRTITGCKEATMVYSKNLLTDTINYFKSGCTVTSFKEKVEIKKPYSKVSFDGREAQYQKWLAQAKIDAQKLAREKCAKAQNCR